MLCYARLLALPKNFSAHSDPVLFCASDKKRLELELDVYRVYTGCIWGALTGEETLTLPALP